MRTLPLSDRLERVLLLIVFGAAGGLAETRAAIPVGLEGTGVLTFNAMPAATEWATGLGLPGGSGNFVTAAELDAATQALWAGTLTEALPVATSTNPAPGVNLRATYNSAGRYLLTRPGGVAASVLLATMRNDTGTGQFSLTISYTFRLVNPPYVTIAEEVPGVRVFFSLTGEPGSWQLIPELSTGISGPLWARLPLVFWPEDALLYLLWVDDNSFANADNSGPDEGAYAIDDFRGFVHIVDPFSGVTIFSPASGQTFAESSDAEFFIHSTPGLGAVTNVFLYDGTNLVGQASTPPLPVGILYTNAVPGLHQFTAVGDNSGILLTSSVVNITVKPYQPSLSITDLGFSFVEISWPERSTGFELQFTTDLRTLVWEKAGNPDWSADGFHHIWVDASNGFRFFRLEKR